MHLLDGFLGNSYVILEFNETIVYFFFFKAACTVIAREQGPLLPPGMSDKYGRQLSDYCKGVRLTAQITKAYKSLILHEYRTELTVLYSSKS